MSDASAFDLGKFIPGFDFLQQLVTPRPGAGSLAPALGGWVAPTVSVEELDRRIQELKAVQFWLDQNVTAIKATIQALEVQKMTLATLQGMNLSMTEVVKTLTLPTGDTAASTADWPYAAAPAAPAAAAEPAAAPVESPASTDAEPSPTPAQAKHTTRPHKSGKSAAKASAAPSAAASVADPMLWWGALTQQFQQIAANALREVGSAAPASAKPPKATGKSAAKKKTPGKKAQARRSAAGKSAAATPSGRATTQSAAWPLPSPAKPRR